MDIDDNNTTLPNGTGYGAALALKQPQTLQILSGIDAKLTWLVAAFSAAHTPILSLARTEPTKDIFSATSDGASWQDAMDGGATIQAHWDA